MAFFGQPNITAAGVGIVGNAINQAFLFKPGDPAQDRGRWNTSIKADRRNLHFGSATIGNVEIEQDIPAWFTKQASAGTSKITLSAKAIERYGEFETFQFRVSEGVQTKLHSANQRS